MTQKSCSQFESLAWRNEPTLANPAVVHAILSLSNEKRTSETIWRRPTVDEWRKVARVVAEYSDDGDDDECVFVGDRIAWGLLWGLLPRGGQSHRRSFKHVMA